MKKITPSIVMVDDISSSVPRSTFPAATLDDAAELILEMGGLIRPLILQQDGIDSYIVVDGDLEYWAAVRAEEINPMEGETINAFVIKSKKDVDSYKKQMEMFKR